MSLTSPSPSAASRLGARAEPPRSDPLGGPASVGIRNRGCRFAVQVTFSEGHRVHFVRRRSKRNHMKPHTVNVSGSLLDRILNWSDLWS